MRSLAFVFIAFTILAAPGAGAEEEKPRVLVLTPTSEQVEPQSLKTIGQLLTVELQRMGTYDVISASDVQKMMELEAEKQQVGCADDSCLAELAGAMGAELVVFGDVGKLGSVTIVTLNLFNSSQAKSTNRTSIKVNGLEELPDALPGSVAELVGESAPERAARVTPPPPAAASTDAAPADTPPPGDSAAAPPSTEGAPVPDEGGGVSALALVGFTALGVGGAVGLAGLGFDLLSPTSGDYVTDVFDFVGPGVIASGVVLAAIGGGLVLVGGME